MAEPIANDSSALLQALQQLSMEEQQELLEALEADGSSFTQFNFEESKNFQVSVEQGGTANNAETININHSLEVDIEALRQTLDKLLTQHRQAINQDISGRQNQGIGQVSDRSVEIGPTENVDIYKVSTEDSGAQNPEDATLAPPYYYPSDLGSTNFVGRSEELEQLHQLLQSPGLVAITAATGMGGIGKTELAWQYAQQCERDGSYPAGIWWLNVRGANLSSQILSHSLRMGLGQPPDELAEEADKVEWCFDRWGEVLKGKRLLILDNVTDYGSLRVLLPQDELYHILFTTRQQLNKSVKRLNLGVLKQAAAFRLLRQSVDDDKRLKVELQTAIALCDWLGRLPLGIELVGRYLARKPDLSLVKLLGRLKEQQLKARSLQKVPKETAYQLPLEAAFELSWQALSEAAQDLGCLLSLFALAPIPWRLVEGCYERMDSEVLEELRNDELLRGSLLERSDAGEYNLNRVIREAFASKRGQWDGAGVMQQTWAEVLVAEAKAVPQTPTLSVQEQMAAVIPHLEELAQRGQDELKEEDATWPHTSLGRLYKGQSLWQQAEYWCRQAVEVSGKRFGPEHPATAQSLNNLAELYRSQGRYSDANPLIERALAIRESQLGPEHPATAQSLNNLAELYRSQGRYNEAKPLIEHALAIRESQLGPEHPDTAQSLNNLAELYRSQGRYDDAAPLYKRALAIYESQLGPEHPDTAQSLNNLAELYRSQGRYSDAEPLIERALAISESQLGPEHPDTASSLNNLAELYRSQGRYSDAEPLYESALAIRESQLGPEHPYTASSLNNLAELYYSQGHDPEAEPLYERALAIYESQLGPEHPSTASSLNNLARLFKSQGRYDDADPLYKRALAIYESQLGPEHPSTARSLNNLAGLFKSQGRYDDAGPLYKRALAIYESQLGPEHPSTASSLNNLAGLYDSQGRYGEAEVLYLRALHLVTQTLGPEHPNTQTVWSNFLKLLDEIVQNKLEDSLSEHPLTQKIIGQLMEVADR